MFVDGTTDPEAYLLLEASGADRKTWQFAFARMNLVEFRAEYRGLYHLFKGAYSQYREHNYLVDEKGRPPEGEGRGGPVACRGGCAEWNSEGN